MGFLTVGNIYDYSLFAKNYIENIPEYETFSDLYNPIFKVSNSAWVSDTFEVKDTYKNVLDTNYKAEVFSEDFTDKEKALNDINSWIDTETNGFIPKALDDINPSTMLSLINTVYFEDEWDNPGTLTEADFTNVNGETSKVDTFYSSSCSYYMENEQATAFVKPYKNGLSFIGILPNEGISKNSNLDFNLENIDLVSLLDSKTEEYDVLMQMPTFEFDTTSRLNDLMYAENLDCLLDSRADFSGISETEKLLISDILQISRIKVDENGSKAAAATIMMMKMSAYNNNPKERKEVILDRPFAFMIYDFDNEEVVFIGKVLDVK